MTALTSGLANWKLRYSASGSVQIQTVRNLARRRGARSLKPRAAAGNNSRARTSTLLS